MNEEITHERCDTTFAPHSYDFHVCEPSPSRKRLARLVRISEAQDVRVCLHEAPNPLAPLGRRPDARRQELTGSIANAYDNVFSVHAIGWTEHS
ncbi:MAG TPA: hypothetical protein VJB16_05855 [archaeon]|nr:hypothetical protein [archaeon]